MVQVILITGASSGIGKATAEHLARLGYRVFGASLNPEAYVTGVKTLFIDVTNAESVQTGVQEVLRQGGPIDILINNAGILGAVGGPEEISRAQWERVINTNLLGMIEMTKAVLPGMRERRSGLIINVSSIVGMIPLPYYFAPYITSKHAIEGYTEVLRGEVKPFGIKVASIQPAIMNTQIEHTIDQPDNPLADYAPYRQRAHDMEKYGLEHGRDPHLVAEAILGVIRNPDPPLRTAAGKEARILLPLLRPIPHRSMEMVLHWLFISREPWHPEREPLRRLFMDPKYADELQHRWTLAMLLVVPILFFISWFRRSR